MLQELVIIKIGGSVFSDKNTPFSFHKNNVQLIVKQIRTIFECTKYKVIIIHGGGSFGHPYAKKYHIAFGKNGDIKDQMNGLALTHNSMLKLTAKIQDCFQEEQLGTITITPSLVFSYNYSPLEISPTTPSFENLIFSGMKPLKRILNYGLIPILHGDYITFEDDNFTIISGDRIISTLVREFQKDHEYRINEVVFLFDREGLFSFEDPATLYQQLTEQQLENIIQQAQKEQKTPNSLIDVTNGILGKLDEILVILKNGNSVNLIGGLEQFGQTLEKLILDKQEIGTKFIPK